MHKRAVYDLAVAHVVRELHLERRLSRGLAAQAPEAPDLELTRVEQGSDPLGAGGLLLLLDYFQVGWREFRQRVQKHFAEAEAEMR
jgi:hypothetical protein